MRKKLSIIENIYGSDILTFNESERKETDELEESFFKEELLKPDSKLGIAISNFAMDYSSICREYGFKEGFRCAMLLMAEVISCE